MNENSTSPTPWDEFYKQDSNESKAFGKFQADILSATLEKYVTKILLPEMERRIRYLHQQVEDQNPKGEKQICCRWIWRKPGELAVNAGRDYKKGIDESNEKQTLAKGQG